MLRVLFVISLLGVLINTHPIDLSDFQGCRNPSEGSDNPMINAGYFGGDMAGFDPDDAIRNGVLGPNFRWPNGVIPYEIDHSLTQEKHHILAAMQHYHDVTCIRFVERTWQRHYVYIFSEKGCWSSVGRQFGRQRLSLGPGCLHKGTIIHELLHAVGFWHEQNRPDRDSHIRIFWENIAPAQMHNFQRFDYSQVDLFNETYDISSIMQYGETAFSVSNTKPTIKSISGEKIHDVHLKSGLSESDKRRIKRMYNC